MSKKKKKKNKDKKIQRKKQLENIQNVYKNSITLYKDIIWKPILDSKYMNENTHSWYNSIVYTDNNQCQKINLNIPVKKEKCLKSIPVKLHLTDEQKSILNRWFNAYTMMYNYTLKFIKESYIHDRDSLNFYDIRSIYLFDLKNDIIQNSQLKNIERDTKIKTHIIDTAIHLAVSNYKSALTNLKRGNIKYFRIRYWKFNRANKILEIEKTYFRQNTLCSSVFGNIKCSYDGNEYKLNSINHSCKLQYKYKTDEYILYVPSEANNNKTHMNKNNCISLDPGIRTFMTGLSDNEVVKIGTNVSAEIDKYITKIDKLKTIQNKKNIMYFSDYIKKLRIKCNKFLSNSKENNIITEKINIIINDINKFDKILSEVNNLYTIMHEEEYIVKKKLSASKIKKKISEYNKKITDKVADLHWKSINYLTSKYKNILIGDMSVKGITNKNTSILSNKIKRIGYSLSFYKYRQRLEYKCKALNIGYYVIDEMYTSKMCSNCGWKNNKLNGNKIFNCSTCNMEIDRDINGCRGIYIKYMSTEL